MDRSRTHRHRDGRPRITTERPPGRRILQTVATSIVVATIAGCAVTYDETHGYRGVLGCINLTGPGFSLSCPEGPLRQPAIPNTPQPTPPPTP